MKTTLCALALLATLCFASANNEARAQGNAPVVMGYYPAYRGPIAARQLRSDRFDAVIYSFATANARGALDVESCADFPAFVQTVHGQNLRAIVGLSGGGNGDEFAGMVRDAAKRARFVAQIGDLVRATKADGVALDWEQPTASDKPLVTLLVRELRTQIKAANPGAQLVLVVGAGAWSGRGYDGPALRELVDVLQIMSYDFHGAWSEAGHHTNLFAPAGDEAHNEVLSYPSSLAYWRDKQGFPVAKITMGIAGYGRGFRAPEWGAKASGQSDYPALAYADILPLIGHGWTRQWDEQARAPWLLSDDKSQRISYDDPQSVAEKARWMKGQGLAGFFIWELTQEEVGGDNVLTAAARRAWQTAPDARR